ncbi:MAG: hypothetical protein ABIQ55_13495 [Gemmatimonadaceae bacterium]
MTYSSLVRFISASSAALVVGSTSASAQQLGDSAAAHRKAVRAQSDFELYRRQSLPVRAVDAETHNCDARIGRFCQWNSVDDTIPPGEPRGIGKGRVALIKSLEGLSKRAPRDGWIAGQRVRYLLEAGNDSGALAVARSCEASEWWCAALLGLTLHESEHGLASDSAFAHALATMPPDERCRWTDMSLVLNTAQRKRFGAVGCGQKEELAARLWWLSDPFLAIPGNDRQAEHYSRHTMALILQPTKIVYNLRWADDLREMVVRYGWARYWTRGPGSVVDAYNGAVSGHEPTPNYHFVPASWRVDSLASVTFDLDQDRSAERYTPLIASRLKELNPQVAMFRRGDSVQVVAAYDVSTDRDLDSGGVSSSLVLAADEKSQPAIVSTTGVRGALTLRANSRPQMMSLEILRPDTRHAGWRRQGVWLAPKAAGEVALSDILLFEPGASEVRELSEALPSALGSNVASRAKLGIYWEVYGLAGADSALPMSLTLTRIAQGPLERLGGAIGVTPRTNPLSISWRESPSLRSITTRSVVLDLSLIPKGRYSLRIEATPKSQVPAATTRVIEIR